jgi:hypothetical protein
LTFRALLSRFLAPWQQLDEQPNAPPNADY